MIVGASLILASNHVLARYLGPEVPPMGLTFWRMAIGALVLLPIAGPALFVNRHVIFRHWKLFVVMALLFVPLSNGLIYVAYNWTTALNGGIVSAAEPTLTVLISWLLFADRINWKQGAGIAIAAIGVWAIIARGDLGTLLALEPNAGDLLMLAATIFMALHMVLIRLIPGEITIRELVLVSHLVGTVMMIPLYAAETIWVRPVPATLEVVGALLWIGIAVTVLAVSLTNAAVRMIGANKASMATYLRAAFTAVLAIALLGETFETYHALALAMVVGGVWLMTRARPGAGVSTTLRGRG